MTTVTANRKPSCEFIAPGGFYNFENSAPSNLSSKQEKRLLLSDENETQDHSDISNAKLAEFFREKGDEPLSEVEYEGVLSLMKKSKSVISTPRSKRKNSINEELNPKTRMLRSSKSSTSGTPFKTPSFKPKYEESSTLANTSMRSLTSSTSSRRRVFDYSQLPSPYRTTVYKYSATVRDKINDENESSRIEKPPIAKKLSNTASALVSLLDDVEVEKSITRGNVSSSLANPYSSQLSQIRKYKKLHGEPRTPKTPSQSSDTTPVKSRALEELENSKNETKNADTASMHTFEKYKPSKSSSLRVAVSLEESPKKKEETTQVRNVEGSVPQSSFNFTFGESKAEHIPSKSVVQENKQGNKEDVQRASNVISHPTKGEKSLFSVEKDSIENEETGKLNGSHINIPSQSAEKPQSQVNETLDFKIGPQKHDLANPAVEHRAILFDFGLPPNSQIDPKLVSESQVERFKSLYVFQ